MATLIWDRRLIKRAGHCALLLKLRRHDGELAPASIVERSSRQSHCRGNFLADSCSLSSHVPLENYVSLTWCAGCLSLALISFYYLFNCFFLTLVRLCLLVHFTPLIAILYGWKEPRKLGRCSPLQSHGPEGARVRWPIMVLRLAWNLVFFDEPTVSNSRSLVF